MTQYSFFIHPFHLARKFFLKNRLNSQSDHLNGQTITDGQNCLLDFFEEKRCGHFLPWTAVQSVWWCLIVWGMDMNLWRCHVFTTEAATKTTVDLSLC